MNLPELKQSIKNNEINPVYIFTGPEQGIMNIYIEEIAKRTGKNILKPESFQTVVKKLKSFSITGTHNVYVIRDDKDFMQDETMWKQIEALVGKHTVIFIYSNVDKRGKFYKHFSTSLLHETGYIVEFEKLTTQQLSKYVMKNLEINTVQAAELCEMCSNDYNRVMIEVDKIKHLEALTDSEAYERALNEKLIYVDLRDVAFEFVGAVMQNNSVKAFDLLEELKEAKESEVKLLSLLYNNFRNVLLVQGCEKGAKVSEKTGLSGWFIQLAKQYVNCYETSELVENLQIIRQVEKSIKTGKIDASQAMDYCLLKVLR